MNIRATAYILSLVTAASLIMAIWISVGAGPPTPEGAAPRQIEQLQIPRSSAPPDHRSRVNTEITRTEIATREDPWSGGSVRGRIVTTEGEPIAGAAIKIRETGRMLWLKDLLPETHRRIQNTDARSRSDGTFCFFGVPQRTTFTVSVNAKGFIPIDRAWDGRSTAGETTDVGDIAMQPGLVVRGIVVDVDGKPVPLATVTSSRVPSKVLSDINGRFQVPNLGPGTSYFRATAPNFAPSAPAQILGTERTEGTEDNVQLVMTRGHEVAGRIVDRLSNPIPGASIEVAYGEAKGSFQKEFTTDANGYFKFQRAQTAIRIEVHASTFRSLKLTSDIEESEVNRDFGDVPLDPLHRVRFLTPIMDDGVAWMPTGAIAGPKDRRQKTQRGPITADAAGFSLWLQRGGDFRLLVNNSPWPRMTFSPLEFSTGSGTESGPFRVRIPSESGVVGRVIDERGRPVRAVRVMAYDTQESKMPNFTALKAWPHGYLHIASAMTDLDGRYRITAPALRWSAGTAISIHPPFHAPQWRELTPITDGEVQEESFILQTGARLDVTALDLHGRPTPKTPVVLFRADGYCSRVETDATGRAWFDQMPAGKYEIAMLTQLSDEISWSDRPRWNVDKRPPVTQTLELSPGGKLSLNLRATDFGVACIDGSLRINGDPFVPSRLIAYIPYTASTSFIPIRADKDGVFHTPLLPAGRVGIGFELPGPHRIHHLEQVDLDPGMVNNTTIDLWTASLTIRTVQRLTARPLEAEIRATSNSRWITAETHDGVIHFEAFPPGDWTIEVRPLNRDDGDCTKAEVVLKPSESRELVIAVPPSTNSD